MHGAEETKMKRKTLNLTLRLSETLRPKVEAIRKIDHGMLTLLVEKAIEQYKLPNDASH